MGAPSRAAPRHADTVPADPFTLGRPASVPQFTFTSMAFGRASSDFGSDTVRTPSL